jgi:hypothetical protein
MLKPQRLGGVGKDTIDKRRIPQWLVACKGGKKAEVERGNELCERLDCGWKKTMIFIAGNSRSAAAVDSQGRKPLGLEVIATNKPRTGAAELLSPHWGFCLRIL